MARSAFPSSSCGPIRAVGAGGSRSFAERVPYTPADPLSVQIGHFCDVIRGEAHPVVSGREGLNTLRVIEAVKTAAKTGSIVGITR